MATPCLVTSNGLGFQRPLKRVSIAYSLLSDRGFSELWKELPITDSLLDDLGFSELWGELPITDSLLDDRGFSELWGESRSHTDCWANGDSVSSEKSSRWHSDCRAMVIQWALKRAPDRIQIACQRAPSWLNLNEGLASDTHCSFKIRGSCE